MKYKEMMEEAKARLNLRENNVGKRGRRRRTVMLSQERAS